MARGKKLCGGYTLIELLFTVVMIGLLASFALPKYMQVAEHGRIAEAKTILSALRDSQVRYMTRNEHFTNNIAELDAPVVGIKYFTMNVSGTDTSAAAALLKTTVVATCTRNNFENIGGFTPGYDVSITQEGAITSTDATVQQRLL